MVGMEEKHRKLLRSNRMDLVRDMDGERVASFLYSSEILSEEDRELVNAETTPQRKNEKLLDILPKRGGKAFAAFCDTLRELKLFHLEVLLRHDEKASALIEAGRDEEDKSAIDGRIQETKDGDLKGNPEKQTAVESEEKKMESDGPHAGEDQGDGRFFGKSDKKDASPHPIQPKPKIKLQPATGQQSETKLKEMQNNNRSKMYCMLELLYSLLYWLSILTLAFIAPFFIVVRIVLKRRTRKVFGRLWNSPSSTGAPMVVGFFHPYCNAGGGGERVLWCGIRALQRRYEFVHCVVYTGDLEASPEEITARAFERFNIELERPVSFIFLTKRRWVEAKMWPYFTLLGQSLGSMLLGFEALWKFVPDVCIDTMGYAFTYPMFRFLGGCRVGCYVHYPTISTDMLTKVRDREETYNNAGIISKSFILTQAKLLYYKLFAFTYGLVGKCSSIIMVNSSWTQNHVLEIWKKPECTTVVYPPCDTTEFSKLENSSEVMNTLYIISIGQFRPEKNHALQVKSFAKFLQRQKSTEKKRYKLLLVGSCRNAEDEKRVDNLMELCGQLKISEFVEFHLNVPFSTLKELLSRSTIGIHTMWNEHFGIGVVEFMAAGVITLAHDSGGPQLDIVVPWKGQTTGFRALDEKSYSKSIGHIFEMGPKKRDRMRIAARESVQEKFSEEIFENEFLKHTEILMR